MVECDSATWLESNRRPAQAAAYCRSSLMTSNAALAPPSRIGSAGALATDDFLVKI